MKKLTMPRAAWAMGKECLRTNKQMRKIRPHMFAVGALGKQMQEDPKLEAILVHSTFQEPVQPGLKTENLSKKRSSSLQPLQHFQSVFTEDQMLHVKETLRGTRSVKPSEMLCAFDTDSITSFSSTVDSVVSLDSTGLD